MSNVSTKPRLFPIPEDVLDNIEPLNDHMGESLPNIPTNVLNALNISEDDVSKLDWFDQNDIRGWYCRYNSSTKRNIDHKARVVRIGAPRGANNLEIYDLDLDFKSKKGFAVVWSWSDFGRRINWSRKVTNGKYYTASLVHSFNRVYHVLKAGLTKSKARSLARSLQNNINAAEAAELASRTLNDYGAPCRGKLGRYRAEVKHSCVIGDVVRLVHNEFDANTDRGWLYQIVSEIKEKHSEGYYQYEIKPIFTGFRGNYEKSKNQLKGSMHVSSTKIEPVDLIALGQIFAQMQSIIQSHLKLKGAEPKTDKLST